MGSGATEFVLKCQGQEDKKFLFERITRLSLKKTGNNSNSGRKNYISEPNQNRSGRKEVVIYQATNEAEYKKLSAFLKAADADRSGVINMFDAAAIEARRNAGSDTHGLDADTGAIWDNNKDGTTFEIEF